MRVGTVNLEELYYAGQNDMKGVDKIVRPGLLNAVGGIPDRLLMSIPEAGVPKCPYGREEYLDLLAFYDPAKWKQATNHFYYAPVGAPEQETLKSSYYADGERLEIAYPSRYKARSPAVSEIMDGFVNNRTCYLNLWRHLDGVGRKLVLCIHGFMMGSPRRSERIFKIRRLFDSGLDVALYSLPHHWKRGDGRQRLLNPENVPLTAETFGQNIHDLHSVVLLLKSMGYGGIGIIGASMGGMTAGLYATIDAPVDFMFMAVPAVRVDRYLAPRAENFSFEIDNEIRSKSRVAMDLFSPLTFGPVFSPEKIAVVAHAGDRICEHKHTQRWVDKWGVKENVTVTGGHWLYLDRKIRGITWRDWLKRMGYV